MVWVRIDDHFDEHPKFAQAGPLGMALWVAGLAYCNRNLTDGFIPWATARTLVSWEFQGKSTSRGRPRYRVGVLSGLSRRVVDGEFVIDLLLASSLWEEVEGGYHVHDFDGYQPTKAEVEAERAQKQAAGQAGGIAAAKARAKASAQAPALAESKPVPGPGPVRTGSSPPYPPLPFVLGGPNAAAPRAAGPETAVVAGKLIELPNGAHQCPLCPDIFTGSYGDHLATSKRHKVRDEPEDFGRNDKPETAAEPTPPEITAELANMASRPTAEQRYLARQQEDAP